MASLMTVAQLVQQQGGPPLEVSAELALLEGAEMLQGDEIKHYQNSMECV